MRMRSQAKRVMELPDAPEGPQHAIESGPVAPAAVLVDGRVVSHTHAAFPRVEIHPGTCGCSACQAARPPESAADFL